MSKKKKIFKSVRLEKIEDSQTTNTPQFDNGYTQKQIEARLRYLKTKKKLKLARQFAKNGKPRLRKD